MGANSRLGAYSNKYGSMHQYCNVMRTMKEIEYGFKFE